VNIKRKIRRSQANKSKKKAEKALAEKVALFGHLPNKCLTCEKPFDKMNREQVMTWNVVVRQEEEKVNLYCPECWDKAIKLIKEAKEGLLNKKRNRNAVSPEKE
tara:strand:- start:518 stop:829 length:312 start_codon:yes stop_codon:yes gene_type:complete